ncbi:unnamed protein product [Lasius platythorax]|uniref:MADF domain-containing protein n=1 Tax=Lasius platythorax TaxID=488582 RepID=A0AAV2NN67_9HYME
MENCEESYTQFEDESSLNLLACRELIGLVKSNELLWKKRCISFKDQQMKNLCWTSIGSVLTSVLSGTDAEKEFYKLRQKFGREVRKEKESAPRSGAAAGQQTYKSEWPLYKNLEFLKDVIKPRRTISNFPKKSPNQRPSPSPSPPATIMENSSSPSNLLWNSDLEGSLLSESDGDNCPSMSSPSRALLKRTVPAPDSFYTKKKKVQDSMAIVIEKHSANLNMLTDKITKCLKSSPSPTENQPEDSLILSVSAALTRVPEEKRLSCIIEILQIVQKYTDSHGKIELKK